MNKEKVLSVLREKLNLDDEKINKISNIVEDTFLVGKNNKEKMLSRFQEELHIDNEFANKIYDTVMSVIGGGIKDKLLHPFKDLDKE